MSQLGQHVNTVQLNKFLEHIFNRNNKLHEKGQRGTPIMIWGNHGLGKTHTVVEFAKKNNWKMAYCAPAQFEEMGDLHGMPSIVDPDEKVSGDYNIKLNFNKFSYYKIVIVNRVQGCF